jgi:hypothetical protein
MEQENKKINAMYAIPCKFAEEEYEECFFLTFNTRNEKEALRLASCVCGKQSSKSLVIITEDGDYYDCS